MLLVCDEVFRYEALDCFMEVVVERWRGIHYSVRRRDMLRRSVKHKGDVLHGR